MKIPGGFGAIKDTFQNSNYRLYVLGNLSATTGLWTQRVAIGWLTWDLTQSAAWLGGIAVAESIPTLLLGLFAGALVDRMDYLKMLRIAQALSVSYSVMLAIITFSGHMHIGLLLGLTIFRGGVLAFSRPSRMTLVYALVGRDRLASALAVNSMIFNISRFIGPAIGGSVIALGGEFGTAWAFTVSSTLLFMMTLCLSIMHFPPILKRESSARRSMLSETVDGVRYIVAQPTIRVQLFLLVGTSLFAKPVIDLFPGFAATVFDSGPHGLGMLLSLHGLGAMAGGMWLASRSNGMKGLTNVTIVNILFMALTLFLFTATDLFWVGCIMAVLTGAAFIIMSVGNQTLIQAAVEPDLRGRVISVYGMVAQDVPALGTMMMGALAEQFGLRLPIAVGAGICLILWAWAQRQRGWLVAAVEAEPPSIKQRKD
jgi:predicted MFS family arabinose efflux permease